MANSSTRRAAVTTYIVIAWAGVLTLLTSGCSGGPALPPTITLPVAITPTPVATVLPATATLPPSPTPPPPSPAVSPTSLPSPTATATPTPLPGGQVAADRGGLRVRAAPSTGSPVLANLPESADVLLIGRTADSAWLEVAAAGGISGWVWADFITYDAEIAAIPISNRIYQPTQVPFTPGTPIGSPVPATAAASPTVDLPPPPPSSYVSGITGTARRIYEQGQQMGNRVGVFSKVGDSLTVATYVMYPFGWRVHNLGEYAYYQPAIDYWSQPIIGAGSDSFSRQSLAADNGWTTQDILDPARANGASCRSGETPLECEYRVARPSAAIILIGTNDVASLSPEAFNANLVRIMEISLQRGIIPILTTLPWRLGYDGQVQQFNQIITNTAHHYDTPLLDYWTAMLPLSNNGLSSDGVHPSWPPGDYSEAAHFNQANLGYGYTIRNLTILQALDALWRQVLR